MIKRLVYVNKVKFPSAMPSTVFSALNANAFAQNGIETHFVCQKQIGTPADFQAYFGSPPDPRLQIHTLSASMGKITANELFYLRTVRFILGLCQLDSQDVLLTRDPGFLPFLYWLGKKTRCRIIYQSHNYYLNIKNRPEMNPVNKRWFHLCETMLLPRFHGLLALQSAQAGLYCQQLSIPVMDGRPGLIERSEKPNDLFKHKNVAYVGSFQPMKGLEAAVNLFKQTRQPGWCLKLIGGRNTNEIHYARNLLKRAGIEDIAEITGWLSYADLRKELAKVSIGLLLLEDNFYNRYLTAPSKLFDYLAFGIPVVAANLPSLRDFVTHQQEGLLHPPHDRTAMADSLVTLMQNETLLKQLGRAAYERADFFLWEKRARHMLNQMQP